VALVRTDVSEECIPSVIKAERFSELGTTLLFLRSVLQLLVTANIVPSLLIPSTLMMEVIHSTETLVLTTATPLHILKMAFFLVTPRKNLKSYRHCSNALLPTLCLLVLSSYIPASALSLLLIAAEVANPRI
jgi:hypothetical protein